jgi:hypothetical protein
MAWQKPGAQQNEFTEARYACMQQSQQRHSSAYVNQYGGSSDSSVITNNNLFSACMTSRGWTLGRKPSPAEQTAIAARAQEVMQPIVAEMRQLCSRDDLRPHYSKTPCNPEEASLEQLADKTRITNTEKIALSKLRTEVAAINKRAEALISASFDAQIAAAAIASRQNTAAEIEKLVLEFYEGRLTRGEFNKRRQDLAISQKKAALWET